MAQSFLIHPKIILREPEQSCAEMIFKVKIEHMEPDWITANCIHHECYTESHRAISPSSGGDDCKANVAYILPDGYNVAAGGLLLLLRGLKDHFSEI